MAQCHCVGIQVEEWCLDVEEIMMSTDVKAHRVKRVLITISEVEL